MYIPWIDRGWVVEKIAKCSHLAELIHLELKILKIVHTFRCNRPINNFFSVECTDFISYTDVTSVEAGLIIFL